MDETPKADPLAKAVRSLSIAVWLLAVSVFGLFAFYAFTLYKSRAFFRGATAVSSTSSRTTHAASPSGLPAADEKPFHSLPIEEKIRRSSAIFLTKHEKDGGRIKSVVSEILKRPDAGLNYSVGDEFGDLSRDIEGDADYGDGDVVFFVGGAGEMRESMTYRRGRISGLGDMPLDFLRAMVRGGAGAGARTEAPSQSPIPPLSSSERNGPMIELQRTTNGEGVTRTFAIPRSAAMGIPEWFPEKGQPPLEMSKAIQVATDAASAQSPEHSAFVARSIRLQLVNCDEPAANRWYYVLDCVPRQNGSLGMGQSVPVVVLMDGTVVTGTVRR